MGKLKKEYDKLTKQRGEIIEEIKSLEEDATVKRYLELKRKNETLYNQQLSLYKDVKKEEYESCKHILVYSNIEHDRYEGRTYKDCGCIKCGLDTSVLDINEEFLTDDRKIMCSYLKEKRLIGIETKIKCDLRLAQAIYFKIKQAHPDIDDETAIKYFEIALDNIRGIEVSDARKASRAKRLSLYPNFRRWNASDVCHG